MIKVIVLLISFLQFSIAFADELNCYIQPGDPKIEDNFIDRSKPAGEFAAKLWWDNKNNRYVRQIVLYNDTPRSVITKYVYDYVMSLTPPKCGIKDFGYRNSWPKPGDFDFSKLK